MLEITIDELLRGKATTIKKANYFPTAFYVEPFLERVSKLTSKFNVNVELPSQITKTINGNIDVKDLTYNRIWIEGVLPHEYSFDGHEGVIGMVMGLDVRKPVFKVYKGAIRSACTNLCVFNPEMLKCQEIESETALNYDALDNIINTTDDIFSWIQKLKNTQFSVKDRKNLLGNWIDRTIIKSYDNTFGKVKLSSADVISAYKDMFYDDKSDYYVEVNGDTSMFNVYNAFTQQITDNKRDLISRVEKTLLVKDILDINDLVLD